MTNLPPGYVLDQPPTAAGAALPKGYTLDAPAGVSPQGVPLSLPDLHAQAVERAKAGFRAFTNPFGISDEIGGAITGVGDVLSGGSFREGYNRFTTKARAIDKPLEEQYPVETLGGAILGGVVTGTPGINLLTVPAKVAKAAPIAERAVNIAVRTGARAANAAATGGAYGAGVGAASAEGGLPQRLAGGFWGGASGAVLGAGLGVAVPAIAEGANWLAGKIAAPFRGIGDQGATEAARRVAAAQTIDAGSPERAAAALAATRRAGIPMVAADLGEASRTLADDARNTSIEGRGLLDRALNARQDTQLERTLGILEQSAPGVNAPQTREMLQQAGRAAKKPAYDLAYAEGDRPIWSPRMEQLTSSPMVVDAMKAAAVRGKDRAITEGYGAFNPGVTVTPDGQVIFARGKGDVPTYPNLQFWDYTKRELDQAAQVARRAGRNEEADVAQQLARSLRTELDQHVKSYKAARGTAFDFFQAENALDAGSNFVTQRADNFQEAKAAWAKMNASEQALFKEGFVQTLVNKLREKGDRQDVVNSLFVKSPAARERIRIALGEEGANRLETHLRFENIFALTKNIQGNSATARRLFQMGIAGGLNYGLPAGLGLITSGGNLADPKAWAVAALTYGARRGRLKIDQNVAREVARLLASDDPQIVKSAINRVAKSPSLLQALRIGEKELGRIIGVSAGQASGASAVPDGNSPYHGGE